ncbi:hypothetical protein CC86DRAFT_468295 [Ophiobolus disseminans]|uniref:Uncharacterized protein n=1 Tax=Ophiobolus disseminans TaxID=1469910 RepID=A0A6A6ZWG6_9PLEO|nr:hypothetical protein CC86DRAFT_468295 [Ophiobolus disseminans]
MPQLLELPVELFEPIIDFTAQQVELPELFRLRAVAIDHILLAQTPIDRFKVNNTDASDSRRGYGPGMYLRKNLGSALFARFHQPGALPVLVSSYIVNLVEELLKLAPSESVAGTKQGATTRKARTDYEQRLCHALGSSDKYMERWFFVLGLYPGSIYSNTGLQPFATPLSQPIPIDSQAPALSPSPPAPITNALQALVSESQAPTFEARIRESRAEDSIVAPPKGSEHATAAASEAPEDDEDKDKEVEAFDAHLMDKYNGID